MCMPRAGCLLQTNQAQAAVAGASCAFVVYVQQGCCQPQTLCSGEWGILSQCPRSVCRHSALGAKGVTPACMPLGGCKWPLSADSWQGVVDCKGRLCPARVGP